MNLDLVQKKTKKVRTSMFLGWAGEQMVFLNEEKERIDSEGNNIE